MNPKLYRTSRTPGQAPQGQTPPDHNPADRQPPHPDPPAGDGRPIAASEYHEFTVPPGTKPCRVDAFLGSVLRGEGISREKIKQAVLSGLTRINGAVCAKPNLLVYPGDRVTAAVAAPVTQIGAEAGNLTVLWRDEHLAVCEKPAGLTVHAAPGLTEGTLANLLLHHFPELEAQGGMRPGIVHRLDKDTSGLMLVALTETARLAMTEAFAARTVKKQYLALVHGVPAKQEGTILAPIGRDPKNKTKMAVVPASKGGKEAHSGYSVLFADRLGRFSLMRVAIHTGRTHQIRVHMRSIGHPLLGDAVYSCSGLPALPARPDTTAKRQMLHAHTLSFTHPVTGETLFFRSAPPEDFRSLALALALPMQRVIVTGSPGGGKSALTDAIRDAGHPAWSADDAVRRLYERGADGWHMLKSRYGTRFVPDDAAGVDKKALFAAMAESDAFRREVEHLVHPLVFHDLETFWATQERQGAALAVAEIPLALESGRYDTAARTREGLAGRRREILAGVYTPYATRKNRMMETRGWNAETVARMESWQWPEDAKIRAVDMVVDNTGTLEDLRRRSRNALGVLAFLRRQTKERLKDLFETFWGETREQPHGPKRRTDPE